MTLELYIDNMLADIDEDTEISLTKEFQSDDDLERKQVEYSYEMDLPVTAKNQKIFGYAADMQVKRKFFKKYNAKLYADHILVLDGKFTLTEVTRKNFVGNLYVPSYKELSDVLGDKNLKDIQPHNIELSTLSSFSDLNYEAIGSDEKANHYVSFPYIVYNYCRSAFGDDTEPNGVVQLTDFNNTGFSFENIYPSYNVLKVVEEIFNTYGYKVSGNVFGDKRFKDLWMTSSFDADDYKEKLQYPQYVEVTGYYTGYDGTNSSETIAYYDKEQNNGDEHYKYFAEDMFHSNMTQMYANTNNHDMFTKNDDGGGSILIRRSGWYSVHLDSSLKFASGSNDTFHDLSNTFQTSMQELRLVKGNARNNTEWFSQFGQAPIVPRYNDTSNEGIGKYYITKNWSYDVRGWKDADMPQYIRVPVNGGVATVHSYSTFDTDDFVCGFRWGQPADFVYDWAEEDGLHEKYTMMALPDTARIKYLIYDKDKQSYLIPLTYGRGGESPTYHAKDTAVVLLSENAYGYNTGYFTLKVNQYTELYDEKIATISWSGANDFSNPPYIKPNSAKITTENNLQKAVGECNCVCWFDEGDTVNMELLTSSNYWNTTKAPNVYVNFHLVMGLLTTDEDWKPSVDNSIPYKIEELTAPLSTNFNQFLPDMTCNDFIEGFLKTFNLRITKLSDNEYSINYDNIRKTELNVVNMDKYFNADNVTEKSIDLPSQYTFKFTIDEDEEGYESGDNSEFNYNEKKSANEKPMYAGDKTLKTNTYNEGDPEELESTFSYNWYKTIWATTKAEYQRWIDAGKPDLQLWTHVGDLLKVPVISDSDTWDKSFADGSDEGDNTSATPRLFYLSGNTLNITREGETVLALALVQNNIGTFDLDFSSVGTYKGIEESMFATDTEPYYEVYVTLAMSNTDYQQINQNTLVMINDDLYRVVKIDGHNVKGDSEGDLVLKALIN